MSILDYFTGPECPVCGSVEMSCTMDYERNLVIFKCGSCGEMYAARYEDVVNMGLEAVLAEWGGCHRAVKRLVAS